MLEWTDVCWACVRIQLSSTTLLFSVAVVGPLLSPAGDVVLLFPAGLPIGWRHAYQ